MTGPSIAIIAAGALASNQLFDPHAPANRDDCLCGFRAFRAAVLASGGEVHTHDVFLERGTAPDIVIHLDVPNRAMSNLARPWPHARRWVILQECEVVLPDNWHRARHEPFERCFTWHREWVDGDRYQLLNFANPLSSPREGIPFAERKLATLVAGNKSSRHPLELYSERVATIRWFEREAPADFDFFGIGWDRRRFAGALRPLNRFGRLTRAAAATWPSWRGTVDDKLETMSRYRFTICYENAHGIPGYVTEKLFDAFSAGTIPVYWGAPDIASHVPNDCYIDRCSFSGHRELVERLRAMDESEYRGYVERIGEFLKSKAAEAYSAERFGRTLCDAAVSPESA